MANLRVMPYPNDQVCLYVEQSYDIRQTLKAHGYLFNSGLVGDKGWYKMVAADAVDAEMAVLRELGVSVPLPRITHAISDDQIAQLIALTPRVDALGVGSQRAVLLLHECGLCPPHQRGAAINVLLSTMDGWRGLPSKEVKIKALADQMRRIVTATATQPEESR